MLWPSATPTGSAGRAGMKAMATEMAGGEGAGMQQLQHNQRRQLGGEGHGGPSARRRRRGQGRSGPVTPMRLHSANRSPSSSGSPTATLSPHSMLMVTSSIPALRQVSVPKL